MGDWLQEQLDNGFRLTSASVDPTGRLILAGMWHDHTHEHGIDIAGISGWFSLETANSPAGCILQLTGKYVPSVKFTCEPALARKIIRLIQS